MSKNKFQLLKESMSEESRQRAYDKYLEWLNEIESFSMRSERLTSELNPDEDSFIDSCLNKWMQAAFDAGYNAKGDEIEQLKAELERYKEVVEKICRNAGVTLEELESLKDL